MLDSIDNAIEKCDEIFYTLTHSSAAYRFFFWLAHERTSARRF